jgi:hypothetical protein
MTFLVKSEKNSIVVDYQRENLRDYVLIARPDHKSGAVFRKLFLTPQKNDFNKLSLARYPRRFTFKTTQKCTWLMRISLFLTYLNSHLDPASIITYP